MATTVSADLFKNLVAMVAENYTINSAETLENFQYGVSKYTQYIFMQDPLIDNEVNWEHEYKSQENILAELNQTYRDAINKLCTVFPSDHEFWEFLSEEEKIYYNYIVKEKYQSLYKLALTSDDFEQMAFAKHCLALVPMKGLEWLYMSNTSYDDLKTLFQHIFNGIQMMDDIDDFTKDRAIGQWNLIQYEVDTIIKENNLNNDGQLDKFEERVFYASGLCLEKTEYVFNQYQLALNKAKEFSLKYLTQWLQHMLNELQISIAKVKEIMA